MNRYEYMEPTQPVRRGQKWRRRSDGIQLKIVRVEQGKVHWETAGGRGGIYPFNAFLEDFAKDE